MIANYLAQFVGMGTVVAAVLVALIWILDTSDQGL